MWLIKRAWPSIFLFITLSCFADEGEVTSDPKPSLFNGIMGILKPITQEVENKRNSSSRPNVNVAETRVNSDGSITEVNPPRMPNGESFQKAGQPTTSGLARGDLTGSGVEYTNNHLSTGGKSPAQMRQELKDAQETIQNSQKELRDLKKNDPKKYYTLAKESLERQYKSGKIEQGEYDMLLTKYNRNLKELDK